MTLFKDNSILWSRSHLTSFRTGVTRLCPNGEGWASVEAPPGGNGLSNVAVGDNVVWAITRDSRVWVRNGVRGALSGENDSLAKGSKWTEMVGSMHMVSVGPRDQVVGVSAESRAVVVRTGVTPSDPSGKTWKAVTAPGSGVSHSDMVTGLTSRTRASRSQSTSSARSREEAFSSSFAPTTDPTSLAIGGDHSASNEPLTTGNTSASSGSKSSFSGTY